MLSVIGARVNKDISSAPITEKIWTNIAVGIFGAWKKNGAKMQNPEKKRLLNIKESADYLGVSRNTIEHWISIGELKFYEFEGRGNGRKRFRRIDKSELDRFLDSRCACKKPNPDDNDQVCGSDKLYLLPRDQDQGVMRG